MSAANPAQKPLRRYPSGRTAQAMSAFSDESEALWLMSADFFVRGPRHADVKRAQRALMRISTALDFLERQCEGFEE